MSEETTIDSEFQPNTVESLMRDFAACGLRAGQIVCVHSSLSALGWTIGGAQAVIEALMNTLTPQGTLMMPAHTANNSDPSHWQNPPIPEAWWQRVRDHMPAFEGTITPTWHMGAIAELFRTFPGVLRSAHPSSSFSAWGAHAAALIATHTLNDDLGETSPIGHLYDLDGYVLLLGVGHGNNTSLHLAEYRADFPDKKSETQGAAMLVDGARQWATYEAFSIDDGDFTQIGDGYEAAHGIARGRVGKAEVHFMRVRPLIDYAVKWMEMNRGNGNANDANTVD